MALTAQQLEQRRGGITATDVPAILGLVSWAGPIDVWRDKCEPESASPREVSDRMKWGNLLEPVILHDYAERHGLQIQMPGTLVHPDHDWAMATPDALAIAIPWAGPEHGIEAKVHSIYGADYGRGYDQVPASELAQCAWGMFVTSLPRWALVPFVDGLPRDLMIERDFDTEEVLLTEADRFWRDHVLAHRAPDPDGSASYARHLKRVQQKFHDLVAANDQIAAEAARLRDLLAGIASLERSAEIARQRLKAEIGPHGGIELPDGGKLTWKRSRSSKKIDWQAVAVEYRTMAELRGAQRPELDAVVLAHTAEVEGSRRFLVPRAWHQPTAGDEP